MLALNGLPYEMTAMEICSTYIPPQYGGFMLMEKASVSPGVSPELSIVFKSLHIPPVLSQYIHRQLEHTLPYRRAPTIALSLQVDPKEMNSFGIFNRPAQTGEKESHGFRTYAWCQALAVHRKVEARAFAPGDGVVSLNNPGANTSRVTHSDLSYPFCEPSSRTNSTLDFYTLLLTHWLSPNKAQVFTATTIQEPGEFMAKGNIEGQLGHLMVAVYRSWAFKQREAAQRYVTDDGVPYWYLHRTGQTFWERPPTGSSHFPFYCCCLCFCCCLLPLYCYICFLALLSPLHYDECYIDKLTLTMLLLLISHLELISHFICSILILFIYQRKRKFPFSKEERS